MEYKKQEPQCWECPKTIQDGDEVIRCDEYIFCSESCTLNFYVSVYVAKYNRGKAFVEDDGRVSLENEV
jgi:hypothetical protein